MKVEVEYWVKKKMVVECDFFDDSLRVLKESDWKTGGTLVQRSPEIISQLVVGNELDVTHHELQKFKEKGEIAKRKGRIPIEKWKELHDKKTKELMDRNPNWSKSKCSYLVKQSMPLVEEEKDE